MQLLNGPTKEGIIKMSKPLLGAILGAAVAVVFLVFDRSAVLLFVALTAVGWFAGRVIEHPDTIIRALERMSNR